MTKDERPESQPVDISSSFNRCHYVAHELANPLGGMLMSVDVIEKYFDANPRAREEIGDLPTILKREIIRLISLVKQLRFSEIPRDDKLQQTSLAVQVREILALQSAYYERRGIRIEQEIGLDLPRMLGDPNKLRQILLNLCNNAVEAMPDGGTLTLRCYASDGYLCLEVADTGNGVPAGMRIFESVVTNKPQGSGFGLLIVRELVEQHRGTVSYTTTPGTGTMFHLKFPLATPDLSMTPNAPGPQSLAK